MVCPQEFQFVVVKKNLLQQTKQETMPKEVVVQDKPKPKTKDREIFEGPKGGHYYVHEKTHRKIYVPNKAS
jgi:hypothetical protein